MKLEGDANDYVGKGLSGGIIIIKPSKSSIISAEENIIAGNTLLYGSISGECYLNGVVGERFAVRNSGAIAIAEGCGDHGCEYMTGGVVVILGDTGRNFSAGMSGGIAYVFDEGDDFYEKCNRSMVEIKKMTSLPVNRDISEEDIENDLLNYDEARLKKILQKHIKYSNSVKAKMIIDNWEKMLSKFVKITPIEYRKALENKDIIKLKEKIKVAGE